MKNEELRMGKRRKLYLLAIPLVLLLIWVVYDVGRNLRTQSIPIVLVPHAGSTKQQSGSLFKDLAKKINPSNIIILTVNHYKAGEGNIIATGKDWHLQNGLALGNKDFISGITAQENDEAFLNEHGVMNLLPELYRTFPQARYDAIMIKEGTKQTSIDRLYEELKRKCDNCLVVASVDFSHYVISAVTKEQDKVALSALVNANTDQAWQSFADSKQIIYLITRWAGEDKFKFHLIAHSNTSDDLGTSPADNVSYFLGYYADK